MHQLEPYKGFQSRHRCPACNHQTKTFTRYINTQTNAHLANHVGRCNREDKCGYHFTPSQYFEANSSWVIDHSSWAKRKSAPAKHPAMNYQPLAMNPKSTANKIYINPDYVDQSFTDYENNNLVQYLIARFGFKRANEMVGNYRIGSSNHWPGATIFWQIDKLGYVRAGKIMQYNRETGKRVKQPFNHITWVHKLADGLQPEVKSMADDFSLNQCFFGEHLLAQYPDKPVAIVESEKTAIISSVVIPRFVWLACGSLNGLSTAKCQVLQGRHVMLFPDVNAYNKWKIRALELYFTMPGTTFLTSNVLERMATADDREKGIDLADVLE
jgi:hypothetical protein